MKNWLIGLALVVAVIGCSSAQRYTADTPEKQTRLAADKKAFESHGYQVARERFFQMDTMRRSVSGRLAELFGETKLAADKRTYSLGLPQILPKMLKKLSAQHPEAYELAQSYADGVNRFLAELPASAAGSPQRVLLDTYRHVITKDPHYVPAKWEVIDCLASNAALSFGLTNSLEETLSFGAIYQFNYALKGKAEQFVDFLDGRPIEPFTPQAQEFEAVQYPPSASAEKDQRTAQLPKYVCDKATSLSDCLPAASASNMWVVGAKRLHPKEKAKALLASDPHLPLKSPAFYMETSIHSAADGGTFNVTGVTIPGIPGIAMGHTDKMAWGVTNSMAHVDQVYVETLNDANTKVKFKDEWVKIAVDDFDIRVRDAKGNLRSETMRVRTVPHHGVLFSEHWKEIQGLAGNTALSFRWNGFDDGGSMDMVATLTMNRAKNFEEFKNAVALNWTSAGNYLFADVDGNIGYTQHGHFPLRPFASAAVIPYLPLPGTGQFEWAGFRTKFPHAYNPPEGYLVVANDDAWGRNLEKRFGNFKNYFTFKSTDGCRAKRIRDGLEARKNNVTVKDMQAIQFDHKDLMALRLVNEVIKPMNRLNLLTRSNSGKLLAGWNGEMARQKKEPLVYAAWLYVAMAKHFEQVIPLGVFPVVGETPAGVQTFYHQLKAKIEANPSEGRQWVLATLQDTEAKLKAAKKWGATWGSDHKLTLANLGGGAPLVGEGRDGSWLTVDVAGYMGVAKKDGSLPDSFSNTYGAAVRFVHHLGENGEIKTQTVLPGGFAGDDQLYVDGKYRELKSLGRQVSTAE